MSRRCQVTGAEPTFGRSVSHSHRRTPRRFDPNVQTKRYRVPSLNRHVRLKLTTGAMRTVDTRGIDTVVARLRRDGVRL